MSMDGQPGGAALTPAEQLRYAREIIQVESQALAQLASRLDTEFCRAAELLFACRGSLIVTGMGKAGLIGQKISATLASTGTRSHFLHPSEARHGDLGKVHRDDVMLVLSQSGETEEITRLLPVFHQWKVAVVALTSRRGSTLGRAAEVVIELGQIQEACSLGLAPSTSTTAMLAMGDALALVVSQMRAFTREDFARFHPAGNLGRQLARVEEYMRPLNECRLALCTQSVREVFSASRRTGRRTGATMIISPDQKLRGIFTDSDLARLFESRRDLALDEPIRSVMTKNPTTIARASFILDAVKIMADRKISELPVVDAAGCPTGLIDITDLVGLIPEEQKSPAMAAAAARGGEAHGSTANGAASSSAPSAVPRPKGYFFRDQRRNAET
ncbi:MAG TPA: KpsF/GutQ family sugar-phosphate isomerase [Pirellulales bacterium]|jgi:arabinose-5-phosphate isomerase|nr:KpsF/GutQ family sugar-phosphate isomerase [Pirellulales bacterium]